MSVGANSASRRLLTCLVLAGITLAVYWPVRHYDLISLDDPYFLTQSQEIQSGLNWHSLVWSLSAVVAANWHPVTTLSFIIDHQLFGTNPGAEHLVNVGFHVLNAMLLFLVLGVMTGRQRMDGSPVTQAPPSSLWRNAMVAALFAWHPLRVESVAWIAERKDVLNGFFLLLALGAYAFYTRSKPPAAQPADAAPPVSRGHARARLYFGLALLFFTLGLMCKAMLVTVPLLLLLLDIWPLNRMQILENNFFSGGAVQSFRRQFIPLVIEKWPFIFLAGLFSVLTFEVQRNSPAMPSLQQFGLEMRIDNTIVNYFRYLGETILPVNLSVYYPLPLSSHSYLALWPDWEICAGGIILAAVSILCLSLISRLPCLAVGWFWYLITLLPVIGLVQVGGQGMADRYTYIPLIGPVIAAIWLLPEKWFVKPALRLVLATTATVVLLLCLFMTANQVKFWKDSVSLFEQAADLPGENPYAHYILGMGLENEGRISEAMVQYRIATKSNPTVRDAYLRLGLLLEQEGKWAAAVDVYTPILNVLPADPELNLHLAAILPRLGFKTQAVEHLETALQSAPDEPMILNNLAWALATSTQPEIRDGTRAVTLARHACEITHYQATLLVGTLAAAYAEAGQFDDAVATAQQACDLARKNDQKALLQKNQELLEQYRQHKAVRE